jgi:hypothetical protein
MTFGDSLGQPALLSRIRQSLTKPKTSLKTRPKRRPRGKIRWILRRRGLTYKRPSQRPTSASDNPAFVALSGVESCASVFAILLMLNRVCCGCSFGCGCEGKEGREGREGRGRGGRRWEVSLSFSHDPRMTDDHGCRMSEVGVIKQAKARRDVPQGQTGRVERGKSGRA